MEAIKTEAMRRAKEEGIIFIDEIIAVSSSNSRQDSKQRRSSKRLASIVGGLKRIYKIWSFKYWSYFIYSSRAFHVASWSIPSFKVVSLRVELDSLDEDVYMKIFLTKLKNFQSKSCLTELKMLSLFDDNAIKDSCTS